VDLHNVHRTSENVVYRATARSTFVNIPYQAELPALKENEDCGAEDEDTRRLLVEVQAAHTSTKINNKSL